MREKKKKKKKKDGVTLRAERKTEEDGWVKVDGG